MDFFPQRNWADHVYSRLCSVVSSNPGSIAVFDFDNTLVKNDFGETVMNRIILDGLVHLDRSVFVSHFRHQEKASGKWDSRFTNPQDLQDFVWNEYSYVISSLGLEAGYRWSSFLFSGWKPANLKQYSLSVWKDNLSQNDPISVCPYREMVDLISFLHLHHWTVYIVTASPLVVIQAVSGSFGVKEENVIGMELQEAEGVFLSAIIEPFPCMDGKPRAISHYGIPCYSMAFGDSSNDFALLEASKLLSVFINKGNPALVESSIQKGFLIQNAFL
jgi:phosphoserine phosphatase